MGQKRESRTVIFDVHNVIFKPSVGLLLRAIIAAPAKLRLLSIIMRPDFIKNAFTLAQLQGLGQGYLESLMHRYPKLEDHHDTIISFINAQQPIKATIRLIEELKRAGYRLYIFSNMSQQMLNNLVKNHASFFANLDGIHCFGPATAWTQKPDLACFRTMIHRFNLQPHTTIFVDNSPRNVINARRIGMDAILYLSTTQLRQEFAKRGLLPA